MHVILRDAAARDQSPIMFSRAMTVIVAVGKCRPFPKGNPPRARAPFSHLIDNMRIKLLVAPQKKLS
jgi:hypothetical protein